MSSRIPVDQFGSSISGFITDPTGKTDCVSRKYVDNLGVRRNPENDIILNTQGKFIIKNPQSDRADSNVIKFYINEDEIHCNSKRVTNLLPPINDNDACTKAYVDNYISAMKRILNESLVRIKFKLIPGSNVSKASLSNEHQFDHNFFIQGVWYLSINRRTWYDSRSDHCKKLKVDFKADDGTLTIFCKNTSLPSELTGDGVLLLKRNINVPITNIPLFPSNIAVASLD